MTGRKVKQPKMIGSVTHAQAKEVIKTVIKTRKIRNIEVTKGFTLFDVLEFHSRDQLFTMDEAYANAARVCASLLTEDYLDED